ncbi:MAG TPA: 1,4-alpha-glucan branching enzyme, partial [Gammaproteobacteria bacterium]|nr:1,4-alpha-glucan branching enzyme [Gammaproteobacteria bacterium]
MAGKKLPDSAGPLAAGIAEAVEAIVAGSHTDPFALLGPHREGDQAVVRAFLPAASRAWFVPPDTSGNPVEMRKAHPSGFFVVALPGELPGAYRIRVESGGQRFEQEDPYRFGLVLGELDMHLIATGDHRQLYHAMGAHPRELDGVAGTAFAVWAPNARRVSVVGDFNHWDGRMHPMRRRAEAGVWELFLPGVGTGALYKFEIIGADGQVQPLKSDPYAFAAELRPGTSSRVHGLPDRQWNDEEWMSQRAARIATDAPVSVYEVHLGS